ncbi:MAG: glycosyltransferase [Flavobacteriaceae bacterium]
MSSTPYKIVFVLPSLKAGGAERVVSFISQNLNRATFDCSLLVAGSEEDSVYPTGDVEVQFFGKKRVLSAVPQLTKAILKRKPDLLFGSIGHVNTILGLISPLTSKTKVVARIASVSSEIAKFSTGSKVHGVLSGIATKNIDHFICQSRDMKVDFLNHSPNISEEKVSIINNPITRNFKLKSVASKTQKIRQFITIGRLSKEKGHSRILKALSQYQGPFHYTIVGNGPLKEMLQEEIQLLNLEEKISQVDHTKEVEKYLSDSDLFLQGSYVEGFPNALLESCAVGTPALAFNAPGGTKEIIEHGINGFLVETDEDFLNYLNKNMDWNPEQIKTSVEKKFNQKHIILQYERLFLQLLGKNP